MKLSISSYTRLIVIGSENWRRAVSIVFQTKIATPKIEASEPQKAILFHRLSLR
ncbi:hypothetical protein [Hyphomonas sp. KY3]|uniref:hypothetical protein n=1 Tax=Hyphomonas sp. KY3 TaxID=2016196 RepID=UPI001A8FE554|nr:hypothetical protein [Hyphomonas sp. KY3]